jgi:putative transposase
MAHTYCSALFHCVFSTKDRRPFIPPETEERLWAYMGGIARENGIRALAIGGSADHVHLLLALPSTMAVATAMREIKRGSSLWMHEACGMPGFAWQEGYGAFSIGESQVEATVAYIANQKAHHSKRDFQAEFLAILEKHRMEYDLRYVWG